MRSTPIAACAAALLLATSLSSYAQNKDTGLPPGSPVYHGYKDTPVQPWSGWHTHDSDRPAPPRVTPGWPGTADKPGTAPSDATVLFDGKDLSQWQPTTWKIDKDGCVVAGGGTLTTKEQWGDCQLHLEFQIPDPPGSPNDPGNRGNNGVMMMGLFEIQIFDSYSTGLYADGQCAAVYAQTPPLVNACRKPGEWQSYDIVVTVPVYKEGKMEQPARVTMFHNGLLVHLNQEVYGNTPHRGLARYPNNPITKGPVILMGHSCPVRFRNIWIRPIHLGSNMVRPEAAATAGK